MNFIIEFFALWSIPFWILASVALVSFVTAAEKQTIAFGVTMAIIMGALYGKSLLEFINWQVALCFLGAYIVIGIGWSIFKWAIWLRKELSSLSAKDKEVVWRGRYGASHNKDKIISWLAFWPFSMIWSLLWILTHDLFESIYCSLYDCYETLSKKLVNKYLGEEKK